MTIEAFVTTLEARLGKVFTEEQKDFIMNLDTPGMCFASRERIFTLCHSQTWLHWS